MPYKVSAYQIAELAANVEEASQAFYSEWARRSGNKAVKVLFSNLASEEVAHKHSFDALARKYKESGEVYYYPIDVYGIMEQTLESLKTNTFNKAAVKGRLNFKKAFDVAVRSEETSVRVYNAVRKTALEVYHPVLDAIIREEAAHLVRVMSLRKQVVS